MQSTPTPRPRRVVIEAISPRFGGAAYASIHIAEALAREELIEQVVVVTRADSLVAAGLRSTERLRVIELSAASRFELVRRLVWEFAHLPGLVGDGRTALLTWSGMLPRRVRARVVSYLANPLAFEEHGLANRLRREAIRRTARHAACLATPTSGMSEIVARTLGTRPSVVPLGVDHERFRPAPTPGEEILCIADFYPHKRHDLLLSAWSHLPEPRAPLRLIGNPQVDLRHARRIARTVEALGDRGRITLQSDLAPDDILAAYQGARVLAVPSEQESFLMPLLEAQACGVPAVVRDIAALRETGGPDTTFVTGDDPAAWAHGLQLLVTDDRAHSRARTTGREHAMSYSWESTARGLAGLLLDLH